MSHSPSPCTHEGTTPRGNAHQVTTLSAGSDSATFTPSVAFQPSPAELEKYGSDITT